MTQFSHNTEEIAKILVKKYPNVDTITLMKIIEDVRHIHMQTFMRERHKEVHSRGYQQGQ